MSQNIALPSTEEVEAYFRSTGWIVDSAGAFGQMWRKEDWKIGVPRNLDEDFAEGIVARLAKVEGRPRSRVLRLIKHRLFDVTYFRAANDQRIVDTIPLDDVSRIITDARNMFRASATTARRERAEIGGSYSRIGDGVIHETLMGHTERGSFIIPIMVPFKEPAEPDYHQPLLGSEFDAPIFHQAQPEPFERRVVRTFAQSLQALTEIVVDPAHEPNTSQVHELVYRGVSREFCSALSNILSQKSVAEIETQIEWGSAIQPPGRIPETMLLTAESADLIDITAQKMRQDRASIPRTLSGPIIQLRSESNEFGEVSISTVYRGRQTEIDVRIPISLYEQAWIWHRAGRAVLVQGTVGRSGRRKSRIESPSRFHPLDEMMLPGATTESVASSDLP
jgi:hypothetical protein